MAERKIKVRVNESHRYGELRVHDQVKFDVALIEWVAERRLRRRK